MRRQIIVILKDCEELRNNIPQICRCVVNGLLISHGLRKDTNLSIHLLRDEINIVFRGSTLKRIYPDEASLKGVLLKAFRVLGHESRRATPHPGVVVKALPLKKLFGDAPKPRFFFSRGGRNPLRENLRPPVSFAIYSDSLEYYLRPILRELDFRPLFLPSSLSSLELKVVAAQFLIDLSLVRV